MNTDSNHHQPNPTPPSPSTPKHDNVRHLSPHTRPPTMQIQTHGPSFTRHPAVRALTMSLVKVIDTHPMRYNLNTRGKHVTTPWSCKECPKTAGYPLHQEKYLEPRAS